jgi:hypothetical protein
MVGPNLLRSQGVQNRPDSATVWVDPWGASSPTPQPHLKCSSRSQRDKKELTTRVTPEEIS